MNKPVIEVRSKQDGVEDKPYFKGSEDEAREWVRKNPDAEVWFMIINGDGLIEEVSLEEFLRHA